MITKDMAIALRVFYHVTFRYKNGAALQARSNGKCQTWKTRPDDFRQPIKVGLRGYANITPHNAHEWLPYDPTEGEQIERDRASIARWIAKRMKWVDLTGDTPWEIGRDKLLEAGFLDTVNVGDDSLRQLATREREWRATLLQYGVDITDVNTVRP